MASVTGRRVSRAATSCVWRTVLRSDWMMAADGTTTSVTVWRSTTAMSASTVSTHLQSDTFLFSTQNEYNYDQEMDWYQQSRLLSVQVSMLFLLINLTSHVNLKDELIYKFKSTIRKVNFRLFQTICSSSCCNITYLVDICYMVRSGQGRQFVCEECLKFYLSPIGVVDKQPFTDYRCTNVFYNRY